MHSIILLIVLCMGINNAQEVLGHEWSTVVEQELVQLVAQNDLSRRVYEEVISRLREKDVPPDFLYQTFTHPEIRVEGEVVKRFERPMEALTFNQYRKIFITQERIQGGTEFYWKYRSLITTIADSFGVDPFLLVSIVGIESKYGSNSREFSIFNALHTTIHKIPRREKWAEKEMAEYLLYCYTSFIPPHSLYGSYAGAFGYGQFIPSSFSQYAVDFDGDGVRHPFQWPDVLASIANYLVKHGYIKGSTNFDRKSKNWRAIIAYNPSASYAKVVLEMRQALMLAVGKK